jgi:hypothetical protein
MLTSETDPNATFPQASAPRATEPASNRSAVQEAFGAERNDSRGGASRANHGRQRGLVVGAGQLRPMDDQPDRSREPKGYLPSPVGFALAAQNEVEAAETRRQT